MKHQPNQAKNDTLYYTLPNKPPHDIAWMF